MAYTLIPHADAPPLAVTGITAKATAVSDHWLTLRWRVEGAGLVVLPPFAGRVRRDELWQTTCFELFVMNGEGPGYAEFNFSPSEAWAAYDFAAYRDGMTDRPAIRAPVGTIRGGHDLLIFDAAIPRAILPPLVGARAGLSVVIEEAGGTKSYWALSHPPGRPDFHDPACFTAALAAPSAA